MKRLAMVALAGVLCGGCFNVCAVRNPFCDSVEVQSVYQGTRCAAGAAIIVAFPQMMSDCPSNHGWELGNIFTIPCGLVVLCDAVLEAAVDTVCLPFDWPVSAYRAKESGRR